MSQGIRSVLAHKDSIQIDYIRIVQSLVPVVYWYIGRWNVSRNKKCFSTQGLDTDRLYEKCAESCTSSVLVYRKTECLKE